MGNALISLMGAFGIRCRHAKTTFPLTPKGQSAAHVTCLDCGREFDYDWKTMRVADAPTELGPIEAGVRI